MLKHTFVVTYVAKRGVGVWTPVLGDCYVSEQRSPEVAKLARKAGKGSSFEATVKGRPFTAIELVPADE